MRPGNIFKPTEMFCFAQNGLASKTTGVHLCLWNIHLVLNGGEALKQSREPFLRGPVVTSQEESSKAVSNHHQSYKSQRNGGQRQGQRISQDEGTRSEVFSFQTIKPPLCQGQ